MAPRARRLRRDPGLSDGPPASDRRICGLDQRRRATAPRARGRGLKRAPDRAPRRAARSRHYRCRRGGFIIRQSKCREPGRHKPPRQTKRRARKHIRFENECSRDADPSSLEPSGSRRPRPQYTRLDGFPERDNLRRSSHSATLLDY
jgi:hypothetical protein